MICSNCEGPLTGDPPAVIHDRVEYRFCSVNCMTDWVVNLDFISPLPAGTNRIYWRSIDFTAMGSSGNQP